MDLRRGSHAAYNGATEHENAAPSRDRKGAVEAVCRRGRPFLTVGARISVIFTGDRLCCEVIFHVEHS
jgi:hypothetical protein